MTYLVIIAAVTGQISVYQFADSQKCVAIADFISINAKKFKPIMACFSDKGVAAMMPPDIMEQLLRKDQP